jgi:hypothetical protein
MRKACVSLLLFMASAVPARAIDLTCSGVMHSYGAKHLQGTVEPQATVVNLDEKYITTPVGEFDITSVSENSVSFGGTSSSYPGLTIFGTLDRVTGHMTVFWRKPRTIQRIWRCIPSLIARKQRGFSNGLRRVERRLPQPSHQTMKCRLAPSRESNSCWPVAS